MVLKELIFNSSIFRGHSGLDRTDFEQFLYCGCYGGVERTDFKHFLHLAHMVVLKELIFNSFWEGFFSSFGGCGGLERTDFEQFHWDVVVLKELIFNSFYIRQVWWSSKH